MGDRFVLVEREAAVSIDLPVTTLGREVRVLASGTGDAAGPVELRVTISGASVLPPPPVHLAVTEIGDGDAALRWLRRSRIGSRWIDGVDAPLGEERELYRVTVTASGVAPRVVETTAPTLTLNLGERSAGATVAVRQIGSIGESGAATITVPAWS